MQPCRRLLGPKLEGSGFMELDDGKLAAEALPNCVGFTFRSAGIGHEPYGRFYVSLRGPASALPPKKPRKKMAAKESADGVDATAPKAGSKAAARPVTPVKAVAAKKADPAAAAVEDAKDERPKTAEEEPSDEEEELDETLFTTYLRIATSPAHDVMSMLAAGADASAQDTKGMTALHHHLISAPKRGSYEVVSALLRAQADVNAMDGTNRATTPLLLVVGSKRTDLLRLLLADAWPPADVDTRTSDGLSALALAEDRGNREVIELLKDAGASVWSQADVCFGSEKHSSFFIDTRHPIGQEA